MTETRKISIVGLGYVGLPLAVALAKHYDVSGFDVDTARIDELQKGHDRTGEIEASDLAASSLNLTADPSVLADAEIAIVTVPTPVTEALTPDLGAIRAASRTLGSTSPRARSWSLKAPSIPALPRMFAVPISKPRRDWFAAWSFFLGYSPERINPGDREHSVERIAKVVAGQTDDVVQVLQEIYGKVTTGEVFVAKDIRTAEAAKVIENAQRDINIAFINEITMIFQKLGISTQDVLAAAATKWNFLNFGPGLVGGHCIGVDPYYLAHCAQTLGHNPEMVLAGRRINDGMGVFHRRSAPSATIGGIPDSDFGAYVQGKTFPIYATPGWSISFAYCDSMGTSWKFMMLSPTRLRPSSCAASN